MDEQLAQIYGTNQGTYDEEDLQKTAAAELLVKLAEEQGVDLSQFNDDEIAELITELYSGETKTAEDKKDEKKEEHEKKETPAEEKKEEAKEKAAEADFLGRVMAHAMVQELNSIEKEAALKDVPGKVKEHAGKLWERIRGGATKAKEHFETVGEGARALATGKTRGGTAVSRKGIAKELATELKPEAKVLGGAAALETARRLGKHQGEKRAEAESSALQTLIEKRAYEILAGSGWVNDQGELLPPPQAEKQASALEQTVDVEALKLLEANGYPVEWNQ